MKGSFLINGKTYLSSIYSFPVTKKTVYDRLSAEKTTTEVAADLRSMLVEDTWSEVLKGGYL
jgi:hypothetical protein